MLSMPVAALSIWGVAATTIAAIIARPFRLPEAIWAVAGAAVLCLTGLMPWSGALGAVGKGVNVYLFLAGMMIASELARQEGVFDYLAALAARFAAGSARRLFLLVYGIGTVITIFMSNDATVVVLTPAILAITRAAKVERPLPYLYACAFVANAASFMLPISNPANLVIFQDRMPTLVGWLARFFLPSVLSILVTYLMLRRAQHSALQQPVSSAIEIPALTATGKWTGWGLVVMAAVMLIASARGAALGWPTFLAGCAIFIAVCMRKRLFLAGYLADISWSVLPLVAGLFVLVEALQSAGAIAWLAGLLQRAVALSPAAGIWLSGAVVALTANVANNLPVGLLAGSVVSAATPGDTVTSAVLIGIDLGPNLSVTGSLATLLWLSALRREGLEVGAKEFLLLGAIVMPPAFIAALLALQFFGN